MTANRIHRTRLTLEALEDRLLLAAGFLDSSFSGDGVVTTSVGVSPAQEVHDVAIYPVQGSADGKVVAVGLTQTTDRSSADFGLVRYNPDGSLDTTFGKGGTVVTSVSGGDDWANAVAVLPDGKILAVGGAGYDVALVRYNVNGTVDTSFGNKGKVVTDVTRRSTDWGAAMQVQSDGKIVVAGMTQPSGSTGPYDLVVLRYNANGTLDTSFGTAGKVITPVGSGIDRIDTFYGNGMDLAIDDQGRIVVVGVTAPPGQSATAGPTLAVVRYTPSGQLDSTFGNGGLVLLTHAGDTSVRSPKLAIQGDGRLVIVSESYDSAASDFNFRLTRLDPTGQLDPTFGTDGSTLVGSAGVKGTCAVAIDPAGRLLVGMDRDSYLQVARFDASGNPDVTFGTNGFSPASGARLADDAAVALAVQANGKAVLASTARTNASDLFTVARFLGDDALTAASTARSHHTSSITASDAQPLLNEALQRWAAEGADVSTLAGLTLHVADLGGQTLGLASQDDIWLDDDAAGWGWFVDPTPADDSEFTTPGNQGEKQRMDLLSVLMHEVGHLLDYTHQTQGLMAPTLQHGQRLTFEGA